MRQSVIYPIDAPSQYAAAPNDPECQAANKYFRANGSVQFEAWAGCTTP